MTVRVITDSSAAIPEAWVGRYPLHVISHDLAWADGSTSRGDVPYSAVATRLAAEPKPPTTGAPAPGLYEQLYTEALRVGERVVVLCPASDLSSTYRSAELAAREVGSPDVRVVDTKTAAAGQGIAAIEAARAAAAGRDLDAVVDRALSVSQRTAIWATLLQLEFLRRSGRVPALAALGANAFRLQPVVKYTNGSPNVAGIVRRPRSAFERLRREWDRSFIGSTALRFVAFHSARAEEAENMCEHVRSRAQAADAVVTEVPAALAAHTGPGLLGIAWFWDN
jgi:DegV family protein with EDD domain